LFIFIIRKAGFMQVMVAVYGTLKRGCSNYFLLEHAEFLGVDTLTAITLYDLGPYPGARQEPSQGIDVEVFSVSADQLESLDQLEGYFEHAPEQGLYDRKPLLTRYGLAWVYLYNPPVDGCRKISRGPWLAVQ
jgi:gamma-glutamylcyclotransferase (GGCT)/AIG2-like uncharacterized protein YtfP